MTPFNLNIDPENNFYMNVDNNCSYYTEDQFNRSIKVDKSLSIIHFNSRSLYANFTAIQQYLRKFTNPFSIIAISETWLTEERGVNFEIAGYELNYINRKNKRGGGVAIYVDSRLRYKIIENMTTAIDDVCECISIEILMGMMMKNVIVSCVYRAPENNIECFNRAMEELLVKTDQKVCYIVGDFNLNLLNVESNKQIEEFVNQMYSMSYYPMISKATRITGHSATLIDNIFTNNMVNNTVSGILITDITDHLPVFAIYGCNLSVEKNLNQKAYRRQLSEITIQNFQSELLSQEWNEVYSQVNVDTAYAKFINIFTTL